jgi:hypothetical protein
MGLCTLAGLELTTHSSNILSGSLRRYHIFIIPPYSNLFVFLLKQWSLFSSHMALILANIAMFSSDSFCENISLNNKKIVRVISFSGLIADQGCQMVFFSNQKSQFG